MKLKKIFFVLAQIGFLMLFGGNAAHAFMGKCKGLVPVSISKGNCKSCHTGSPRKSNYNGVCDVMRGATRNSGMSNIMPVMGVSMDMFSRDVFDDDDHRRFKRSHKDSNDKVEQEHKVKKNRNKDRSTDDDD